jgi:TldD protein
MEYFDQPGKSVDDHAREAVRLAVAMLDAREAPAGEMEVVLAPGDSGILLHEAVGHGLEADFNRKGVSNYSGRIGTPVASSLCTVVDRGDLDHGRGSINVDDEGFTWVPRAPRSSRTASCAGTCTTPSRRGTSARAHGQRAPRELPRDADAAHDQHAAAGGPHDPEEIVRSVKRGIYARRFGGGQVDIASGDFVFSLSEAYLIEDGKLTAPVKDVNLIGNGPDALGKVTMLGNDLQVSDGIWTCGKDGQSVPGGRRLPHHQDLGDDRRRHRRPGTLRKDT